MFIILIIIIINLINGVFGAFLLRYRKCAFDYTYLLYTIFSEKSIYFFTLIVKKE